MSATDWRSELEREFDRLSLHDQLLLIERLARRVRRGALFDPEDFARQMEVMANDPDMKREWKPTPDRSEPASPPEVDVA